MAISVNPAVAAIPYGDRKRVMVLCGGREDLVDLMSGNPYQRMPEWIRRRTTELFNSGPMRTLLRPGEGHLRLSVVSDRDRVEQGVERLLRFARKRSKRRER
jgi:hypothetical protein